MNNEIKRLQELADIRENISFTNWIYPPLNKLKQEFYVEHELQNKNYFYSEEEFIQAVNDGNIIDLPMYKNNISTMHSSKESLIKMVSTYNSWPEFRNEKTVNSIYDGFKQNKPMEYPIVIETNWGKEMFSGNTRLDIAYQLNIIPKILLIKSTINY